MDRAAERFTAEAMGAVRAAIADAGGAPVTLLGRVANRKVFEVRVLWAGGTGAARALVDAPRSNEVLIETLADDQLTRFAEDLSRETNSAGGGIGIFLLDKRLESVRVVREASAPPEREAIEVSQALELLGPEGPVARALQGYEHRRQQVVMMEAVLRAFDEDSILTVEAGTGTGKSLAYLLPALLWAARRRERVVVSTHTINLQEQLVRKDLPFLVESIGVGLSFALVKGRGNYLCKRKAAQLETNGLPLIEDEMQSEVRRLLEWAKHTPDGSLSDLGKRPAAEAWEQVVSENDNCLRARCPFYSSCFFYAARRTAAAADILVVNHHLLLADLALRRVTANYSQNAVLPPATRLVIDEAHHLDEVATSHLGTQASLAALERNLTRLQGRRNPSRGVLPALRLALDSATRSEDVLVAQGALARIEERLLPGRRSLGLEGEECFARLLADSRTLTDGMDELRPKVRITQAMRVTGAWLRAAKGLEALADAVDTYAGEFEGVLERLEILSEGLGFGLRSLAAELTAVRTRLSGFAEALRTFTVEDSGRAAWIELHAGRPGPSVSLHTAPVEVAPVLADVVFDRFDSTILTSATLAVGSSFAHLQKRFGLDRIQPAGRVQELRIDSPFDFRAQAALFVPKDLPEPNTAEYEHSTHEAILRALSIARGGAFVLFTAYGALNRAVAVLEDTLTRRGLVVLQQGQTSRHLLLERFVAEPAAVLFATDSFWEGVDVRGNALRAVIITRLPFRVPTEPIEEARVEAIAERGGNPFLEHSVPQAVIKLRQGFGRLIRSRTDRGSVLLLDSRAARRRYGRIFLASLPPARQVVGPADLVFDAMAAFYDPCHSSQWAGNQWTETIE